MLRKRLIAAGLFVTPMLALFWLDVNRNGGFPGIWVLPLTTAFALLIAYELIQMLGSETDGVIAWVAYSGSLLTMVAVVVPEAFQLPADCPVGRWGWSGIALAVTTMLAFLHEMICFRPERHATVRIALTLFTVLYSAWLLSFLLATRVFLGNQLGIFAAFSILFIVKLSDTGAYFSGKQFGRHKLAPVLSPGKTLEGAVGGAVAALLAAAVLFGAIGPLVIPRFQVGPWWAILAYGASIAMVGVFGDLCESLLKRDMHRKDSSGWLIGLGGIMDMADSVLFVAPVAFLWWTTGLLGAWAPSAGH